MTAEHESLLFGVIFLLLIINSTAIFSLASSQGMIYSDKSTVSVTPLESENATLSSSEKPSATPTETQPVITPTPAVVPAATVPASSPPQYVITILPTLVPTPAHTLLQPALPDHSDSGYITIFSLDNHNMDTQLPVVLFNLVNPPLLIDYNVSPLSTTDVKYLEYKLKATKIEEYINISRPYADSRFIITVRDNETGEIVTKDGYGKATGSYDLTRHMELQKNGNYSFEFDSGYGNVSLTLKVKKEGNIKS